MKININPIAKPRMTKADKWKKRPIVLRYRGYCDELRLNYTQPLPEAVALRFVIPMAVSWSRKKKALHHGTPHKQTPDIDNLVKGLLDALCKDDCYVHTVYASKVWGRYGSIEIIRLPETTLKNIFSGKDQR